MTKMKTEIEFKVILSSLFNKLPGDADADLGTIL